VFAVYVNAGKTFISHFEIFHGGANWSHGEEYFKHIHVQLISTKLLTSFMHSAYTNFFKEIVVS
jgi:hypothetical protein